MNKKGQVVSARRQRLRKRFAIGYLVCAPFLVALTTGLLAQTRGFHKRLLWNFILPHRMIVLANLGRLEEARKVLDELDRSFINSSDVLRHQLWTSEFR